MSGAYALGTTWEERHQKGKRGLHFTLPITLYLHFPAAKSSRTRQCVSWSARYSGNCSFVEAVEFTSAEGRIDPILCHWNQLFFCLLDMSFGSKKWGGNFSLAAENVTPTLKDYNSQIILQFMTHLLAAVPAPCKPKGARGRWTESERGLPQM